MKFKIIYSLILIYLLTGCFELPDEVIAPVWNIDLSVPVTSKSYSLLDAIEDEQHLVASEDPANLGLIKYVDQKRLKPLLFDDKLSVDDFGVHSDQIIGRIKIDPINPIKADILPASWGSQINPGSSQNIPELSSDAEGTFDQINAFESVLFANGTLEITLKNGFPVEMVIRGFRIINMQDQSVICESYAWDPVTIQPQDSVKLNYTLIDKTITNLIGYQANVYTPGSGGAAVFVPNDAGLTLSVGFLDDMLIREVAAIIPQQEPFIRDSLLLIDDSENPTLLEYAEMKNGNFDIIYNNYLDLNIEVQIRINNLLMPDGNPYFKSVDLQRNEKSKMITIPDLSGWTIMNDEPSKYMNFTVTVYSDGSIEPVVLNMHDSVSVSLQFYNFSFTKVIGQISPTEIEFTESDFDLDLNDLNNKLKFAEIKIEDPALLLSLISNSGYDILFNGTLTASNGIMNKELTIANEIIPSNGSKVIDLRDHGLKDFINGFTGSFPEDFIFHGHSVVNAGYIYGSVTEHDSVSVSLDIELPLELGISGGSIIDTIDIDLGDLKSEDFESINFGSLTLEFDNEIPLEASFVAAVLDSSSIKLLKLPPYPLYPHNTQTIKVNAPVVDVNGNVLSNGITSETIELKGTEIQQFVKNPRIELKIDFTTPPLGSVSPVLFKTTNRIKFKISARMSYKVNI